MSIHEEYFRNIFNSVREGILILDENLRVLSANRSFFNAFKVNTEDTIGSLLYDLGNGQWNIPHLRVLLEHILPKNDTVEDYEIEHNFESIGRKIMLLNACKIIEKKKDQPIILLAIEDITERRRLEAELAESEERYRRVYETSDDGIVLLEKSEGHIVNANPAAEKMLGYSEKESIGKKLQDIGVSLETSDFPELMRTLDKRGIINYADVPVKTRSGQDLYTDIYLVDRAKVATCNIRDISERKHADEEMRMSEERFRQIAENSREWIWEVNSDGLYLYANRVVEDILDYKPEEIVGQMHFYDFFPSADRERMKNEALKFVARKKIFKKYVNANVHKNGSIILLETNGAPILDGRGNLLGYRGVSVDITEHRKIEAQLRQSQKMDAIGNMAGGIAHDFNNILNIIIGYSTLAMDKLEAGSTSKEQLHEVLVAAEKGVNLTKRLLAFSRKNVVDMKPVNINELILGVQKMLVRIIKENIELNFDLADRPLVVLADAGLIEQVLINLVGNAKDAMEAGGRLTIRTEFEELDDEYVAAYGGGKPGRYVLITVTDTGHGMDAETQKQIFEPFFTTKNVEEGTGLGLAICHGIIKQHGGYINVYSEPGHGTIFKIYLPFSGEKASPHMKAEAAVPVRSGNETILVAEDDAPMRKLTTIVLEAFGYSVISAEDGEDAITKFMENRERISLVMLDMIMPKKNGKAVSEEIRKVSPKIKILFASGYTMDIVGTKDLTYPGSDFIQKPVSPNVLLMKVREILDR
jgi:PAS domain S-box-containing protein